MKYERRKLDQDTITEIQVRLAAGEYQHDIAADMRINQGRISEVNTGKRKSPTQPRLF